MTNPSRHLVLHNTFKKGLLVAPPDGRYAVFMWFSFAWRNLLEKTIKEGHGQNHLPLFIIRHKNLPYMSFDVLANKETKKIIFAYHNGIIVDELRYIEAVNIWLGKLYWDGTFTDYFWFVSVDDVPDIDFDKIMALLTKKE